jgi:hypothetical protein
MPEINMITVYKIKPNGFLGESKQINPKDGVDVNWTYDSPPSEIKDGYNYKWVNNTWIAKIEPVQDLGIDDSVLANNLRIFRNELLAATDWTQGKDVPDSISSIWVGYRQSLRDISTQETFPLYVTWPEKPAGQ